MYQIKEVADMAGISVRTLHYYDEIDLLSPNKQIDNSYRAYTKADIKRLQDILYFKTFGFKLSQIKILLNDDVYNRRQALEQHKENIAKRIIQLQTIWMNLDKTIADEKGGIIMDDQERFDGFDMEAIEAHMNQYAKEAEEQYGHTDAYRQSAKRTSRYSKDDWAKISHEANQIYQGFLETMSLSPDHVTVQKLVLDWKNHITNHYYTCTNDILAGLGEMYIADERFKNNINQNGEGIADRMCEAIRIFVK